MTILQCSKLSRCQGLTSYRRRKCQF